MYRNIISKPIIYQILFLMTIKAHLFSHGCLAGGLMVSLCGKYIGWSSTFDTKKHHSCSSISSNYQ